MNSVDTNILVYGTNAACKEHRFAKAILETMAQNPTEWILADQVLYEYYRVIRNPKIIEHPLSAPMAASQMAFFRTQLGCLHCGYSAELFPEILRRLETKTFRATRTFDVILAITLSRQGVTKFYTHNPEDFRSLGLFEVLDPIA